MNAADFGVPQKRERVFIVGFRSDLSVDWRFPEPTHSFDALLSSQWITGDYWDRHGIRRADRPAIPGRLKQHLRKTNYPLFPRALLPWRTVRDAIGHLPDPRSKEACCIFQHQFNPGARAYKGHTGSPLDEPAKTLKAGDHGVPGGENMLRFSDGSVRYFTVLESLHLQTFPSHFELVGSWSEKMRQLGNAVPVELARVMAGNILGELWRREPREKRAAVQSA